MPYKKQTDSSKPLLFLHKQDRPCIAEPKREGIPCTFENKLFTKASV